MAKVFISHASGDIAVACELHRWLIEGGHEVFLDRDPRDGIPVGAEWKQQLQKQLRWANAMVCVVTSAYVESSWCSAEVRLAQSLGTRLLPVQAQPGIAHVLLASIQHTDLRPDREMARAALTEALRRVDEVGDPDWPDDRCPFPGLSPFDVDRTRAFFARTREVEQLAELLRSTADERAKGTALLVVGPSGCGKSSLLRAGLLPVMAGEPGWWTLPPIVPGADPVAALARELATASRKLDLNWTVEHIRHQLDEGGLTGLVEQLLGRLRSPAQRLLVVVDQVEELLTQTGPTDRTQFAELLCPALPGPVRMVGALRPEFLDQLLSDSALATLSTDIYPLRPLHRDALRRVIEQPAQLAGIAVDEHLVTQLVEDTDSGNALPLLAFTLAQLADGINRGGRLPWERYKQLGGVQGALARQADAALAAATTAGGRGPEEVIAGLMQLITVDEQGRPTRCRVSRDLLPAPVIAELDAFVTRRLVTTDTDNGNVVIEVAHEAFLSSWPPLAQTIRENVSALRARRAIEQAAIEWNGDDRPPSRLWERGQLAAAVTETGARLQARDFVTDRVDLSQAARTFLRASIRRDRFRRGRTISVLSVLLVLALVAAGIAFTQQRAAEHQRNVALSRQAADQALVGGWCFSRGGPRVRARGAG